MTYASRLRIFLKEEEYTGANVLYAQGLAQPAYNSTKNWFTNPPLPSNQKWSEDTLTEQYLNNAANYPAAGLPSYADGAYSKGAKRQAAIFNYSVDWKLGTPDPKVCHINVSTILPLILHGVLTLRLFQVVSSRVSASSA